MADDAQLFLETPLYRGLFGKAALALSLSMALLLIMAPGTPALAQAIEITGTLGPGGTPGRTGSMPYEPGSMGGAGGEAIALADAIGGVTEAVATGGEGGVGGAGASDHPFRPSIQGLGGPGGAGGAADAEAITGEAGLARARATGGLGGRSGDSGPSMRDSVDFGGRGGDATASATAAGATGAGVLAEAFATGGQGRAAKLDAGISGTGGHAQVSGRGESVAGEDVRVRVEARGGQGGAQQAASAGSGTGGNASLDEISGSTAGLLELQALIFGGRRGERLSFSAEPRGLGGDAEVSIDAVNEGGGALSVQVDAAVETGGILTLGPIRGTSANGADVSVVGSFSTAGSVLRQTVLGGADEIESISLANAVSGETTGALNLEQSISGTGDVESELIRSGSFEQLTLSTGVRSVGGNLRSASIATNTSGGATANAEAIGGFPTGSALAESEANGAGDGDAIATSSIAGSSGGTSATSAISAASARSTARAVASGEGDVEATAEVTARSGANVVAHAYGEGAGAGSVDVTSSVFSNQDGIGDVDISAEGHSLGGGDVNVTTEVRRTDDLQLQGITIVRDAVRGSTAGTLRLRQSTASFLGGVETALDAVNAGGGNLEVVVSAEAFNRFGQVATPGDAILGNVSGTSTTGADVSVNLFAVGKSIRFAPEIAEGDAATVRGVSNGGDVSVSGTWSADNWEENVITDEEIRPGNGNSVRADNWVQGETSGNLSLRQVTNGGQARNYPSLTPNPAGRSVGGDGGEASSRLTRSGSFESLLLSAESRAGRAGSSEVVFGSTLEDRLGGRGGDAIVNVSALNESGAVEAQGNSIGGSGGSSSFEAGNGGEGRTELRAESFGDGNSVRVGVSSDGTSGSSRAVGGFGGTASPRGTGSQRPEFAIAGRGGDGRGRSSGTAHGDATVDVYNRAFGGGGGFGPGGFGGQGGDGAGIIGGRGGDADSEALAAGGGVSRVSATAYARGGAGGRFVGSTGTGGDARSLARATGLGVVEASAFALGGILNSTNAEGGSGFARAEASGAGGTLLADASTGFGSEPLLRASLSRSLSAGQVFAAEARAEIGSSLSELDSEAAGGAMLTARPVSADLENARGRHAGLAELTEGTNSNRVHALGAWHSTGTGSDFSEQTVEFDITLREPEAGDQLLLAVFDQQALNGGFESLSFRIERAGIVFGAEQNFNDLEAAQAYFAAVIGLGSTFDDFVLPGESPALRVIFGLTQSSGQAVSFGLAAVVVPEPGTAMLLGLGLIALALTGFRVGDSAAS